MKYLFGPVLSRRLGRSLGIDLVHHKTCSLNCVYCECGRTRNLTPEPAEWVPLGEVMEELEDFLSPGPELDYCTFSGSGEPTLHSGIGDVIRFIKDRFPQYRVAVLTNGTLLWREDVRAALLEADTVIPSLDAVSEDVFQKMLRPAPGITAERVTGGLLDFASMYRGDLVVEVFILPGYNDGPEEIEKIRRVLLEVNPERVELNSLDRPGTLRDLERAGPETLEEIAASLAPLPAAPVGAPPSEAGTVPGTGDALERILSTLRRRPSTLEDLAHGLGMRRSEILKTIQVLKDRGEVSIEEGERGVFYRLD